MAVAEDRSLAPVSAANGATGAAPPGPERLHRGVLGLPGVVASTMANIGPAMSFYFGFAVIAGAAGVAAPLTIIAAALGIAFVGNTVAQFSRWVPSTGSWVTFIGKGLGRVPATTFAVVFMLALLPGAASLLAIQGGWASTMLSQYVHVTISWQVLCVVLTVVIFLVVLRGIGISTRAAGLLFGFEMLVLIVVSIWVLINHRSHLSAAPFDPSHLSLKGLGLGFPLAIYMFIGWENSAGLAEETDRPRRNVPRAIFLSIITMVAGYVLFSYATVVGFNYNSSALASSAVPFIAVARGVMGGGVFIAYLAGMTSILGCVVAAVNSQARILFSAGREGVLPRAFGRLTPRTKTPIVAFTAYFGVGLIIALVWGHNIDPVTFFGESATLSTIPLVLGYVAANLALIAYAWREHRDAWSPLRHLVVPLAGIGVVAFPLYQLVKPGQPAPYDTFPYIALGFIVVGLIYAMARRMRDPNHGENIGTIIADD
jgi:amino acid transporter